MGRKPKCPRRLHYQQYLAQGPETSVTMRDRAASVVSRSKPAPMKPSQRAPWKPRTSSEVQEVVPAEAPLPESLKVAAFPSREPSPTPDLLGHPRELGRASCCTGADRRSRSHRYGPRSQPSGHPPSLVHPGRALCSVTFGAHDRHLRAAYAHTPAPVPTGRRSGADTDLCACRVDSAWISLDEWEHAVVSHARGGRERARPRGAGQRREGVRGWQLPACARRAAVFETWPAACVRQDRVFFVHICMRLRQIRMEVRTYFQAFFTFGYCFDEFSSIAFVRTPV